MRRLAALFMLVSSLLAVAHAPRAEAAVTLAASMTGASSPATRSAQARVAFRALMPQSRAISAEVSHSAVEPNRGPAAATQIGSDRARE